MNTDGNIKKEVKRVIKMSKKEANKYFGRKIKINDDPNKTKKNPL